MCKELDLLQYHKGVWRLRTWDIRTAIVQVGGTHGVYGLLNTKTNKIYIGEGNISGRIGNHLNKCKNKMFKTDLLNFGEDSIRLLFIVPCNDEVERKTLEHKLQTYYKDKCYNTLKLKYPTQEELINNKDLLKRLKNYDVVDKCWISRYCLTGNGIPQIRFDNKNYNHNTLMYLYNVADFNGITHVLYKTCKNNLCVNFDHMELTTNKNTNNMHKNHDDTHDMVNKLHKLGVSNKDISILMKISVVTVQNNLTNKDRKVGVCNRGSYYQAQCHDNGIQLNLGYYDTEEKALQNRDYYLIKNRLLSNQKAQLNYFDVDYENFVPHKMRNGEINKHLV